MTIFSTFLTVISIIWLIVFVLGISLSFYQFDQLTPRQKATASIDISPIGLIAAMMSAGWLITMVAI